ncbi:hypothetical protein H9I30_03455 [Morganella morganii]|uniref:hypothetical protein n=1 Tax=Morganella morganii TaxID=582 RepID=UPI0016519B3F|nr:hypothetical protein [Morganella morganii]MBC6657080.1 hypothetical protein [Morganella morganii]MBT0375320.1 hypothetical protein [Morganella morganii subsp. morganii]MBT0406968.1 hypothetical protein [Morganella morganii subsp. morganii]MBT0504758.1 hypothetical protein [Morganella morganii subsp. morganii]QWM12442.1 hypothetical protein IZ182_06430 [Morganella morganii subsp. morganii]
MQTEPTITSNMSADDVALWITEKAKSINQLQVLRDSRASHQRLIERLDKEIAESEARCALTVQPQ